jgi:hypothetical protein
MPSSQHNHNHVTKTPEEILKAQAEIIRQHVAENARLQRVIHSLVQQIILLGEKPNFGTDS